MYVNPPFGNDCVCNLQCILYRFFPNILAHPPLPLALPCVQIPNQVELSFYGVELAAEGGSGSRPGTDLALDGAELARKVLVRAGAAVCWVGSRGA